MKDPDETEEKIFRWLMRLVIIGLFAAVFVLLAMVFVNGWRALLR